MLFEILVKIHGELVESRHTLPDNMIQVSKILKKSFGAFYVGNPFDYSEWLIKINGKVGIKKLEATNPDGPGDHSKNEQIPGITLKPTIHSQINLSNRLNNNVQRWNHVALGVLLTIF
jgi:hypothetical protein